MNPITSLRAALAFLTRLPVGKSPIDAAACSWAPALFPLVGAMLGSFLWAAMRVLAPLGVWVSAVVVTSLGVFITGAFHEDGLADTADALGGYVDKERALEILKDSRLGSYGTCALVLGLGLRMALYARLSTQTVTPWVIYGTLARVGPLWLMTTLCHANPDQGKLKDLLRIGRSRAWVGTCLALLIAACLGYLEPEGVPQLGVSFIATAVISLWFARLAIRRLGGITGDLLGAAEQVTEATILVVFAWH